MVSQHLLVFLLVLMCTRAQITTAPTTLAAVSSTTESTTTTTTPPTTTSPTMTTTTTTTTTTTPWIFYPFGSATGDTERFVNVTEQYDYVSFSTPFSFFGRMYNHTYVNSNGFLTFNHPFPGSGPNNIPSYGTEDFIAPLWTELNNFGLGKYWFQEYTNGNVLTRATQDVNQYLPQRGFTASWVFVATWDYLQTQDISVFNLQSAPAITFQVVLISGGGFSFILMNYGDCAATTFPVQAGYDTINSTDSFLIHYSANGSSITNLKYTTNVNIPGRWTFLVNYGSAPEIFYPFGSLNDTRNSAVDDGYSVTVQLLSPFLYFGQTYQQIYINNNGFFTFNQPSAQFVPYLFPAYGGQDIIAALWTDLDNRARGVVSYNQYTNGSVLTRATEDINNHFPNLTFTASWVFIATWDKVAYFSLTSTETSFQMVLISGSNLSFVLMNYGDIAETSHRVEAGYDTMYSTHYFVIPGSNSGSSISNLKYSTNVNVTGRWAFRVDSGPATKQTPWIFYPFGSATGDTERFVSNTEQYDYVSFSTPFSFFGRMYNHTYVNSNGFLTFNQPLPGSGPNNIPSYGTEDFIAPLWTELNNFGLGKYWFQEYTIGNVLTRATQDVNQYLPQRGFTASWVFVATWEYFQTQDISVFNLQSAPAITFQVVLISGGGFSFILMNYGDCAATTFPVQAGYDTINSTDSFLIRYSANGSSITNLKNTTNVNIPGRWTFLVNYGSEPEIFYPFGSLNDTRNPSVDDRYFFNVQLLSPFLYFGQTYQQIYINNNGFFTFNQPSSQFVPYLFPAYGGQDIIAALWTDLDNRARGVISYNQYTNGSVLTRATQDINNHFPNLTFTASWVFIATWDKVAYYPYSDTETSFQIVLISGGNFSFLLMNYGDIAETSHQVEAGYDTIYSTHYFLIPGSNSGSSISNLKYSTNVNVAGRWAFRVDSGPQTNQKPGIFYPFGSATGDTERFVSNTEQYDYVSFSTPFSFFGRMYNHTYVNSNGFLTFNQPLPGSGPNNIPSYGTEDLIAPLWTELNNFGLGKYWFQEYTNGIVLTRATQDVNQYLPQRGFTASWVFVATWDYFQTQDISVFNLQSAPAITFQVVLISGGGFSFILMNYGDCAATTFPVQAGYDTINSTDSFLIPYSANGSSITNLKYTTNVNIPGRWTFLVNYGSAPEIFYPFGSLNDTRNPAVDDGYSVTVQLLSPFLYFGQTYQQIYINNNGFFTFNQPSSQFVPYLFPAYGGQDIIAGLWTDLDNRARGVVSYNQYTNGSVLTRATQDINNHFPNLTFTASWVFIATWDKVAYYPYSDTETSFQMVLISGGNLSFVLMSYGDIAETSYQVEAGYDTIYSTHYFLIPGLNSGSSISNLKYSTNVNVAGRWAFRVDSGPQTNQKYTVGLQAKLTSFLDLSVNGTEQIVLQQIKQELVRNGLPANLELKLRTIKKIRP